MRGKSPKKLAKLGIIISENAKKFSSFTQEGLFFPRKIKTEMKKGFFEGTALPRVLHSCVHSLLYADSNLCES